MVGFSITLVILAVIAAALEYQADQRKKVEVYVKALEDERKKAREDLARFGATDLVAGTVWPR